MTGTSAHLSSRALIRLAGPDWRSFLQGLVTRDLNDPGSSPLAYAALLAPQGRLLHDFFVWTIGDDEAILDVDVSRAAALAESLQRYRLRAKVSVDRIDGGVRVAPDAPSSGDPSVEGWRRDPRLAVLGWRRLERTPTAPSPFDAAGAALFDHLRLDHGVTEPTVDARPNDYPLELNLDLLKAVDFKKGCFVGQETTSRMHRRGGVRSRLVPVRFSGAAPEVGAEVVVEGLRAGEIRSGRDGRALAMLRLDRAFAGPLHADGRALAVDPPDWLATSIHPPAAAAAAAP